MTRLEVGYEELGRSVGQLVERKQAEYGCSFQDAPKLLRILYPNGITPGQYPDVLSVVRILDKLKRIATRHSSDHESPWEDIAGYALLALGEERSRRTVTTIRPVKNGDGES